LRGGGGGREGGRERGREETLTPRKKNEERPTKETQKNTRGREKQRRGNRRGEIVAGILVSLGRGDRQSTVWNEWGWNEKRQVSQVYWKAQAAMRKNKEMG